MANLYVNNAYDSTTDGWGTTHFNSYNGAYAYATAKASSSTIYVEKTTTISGNCFDNNHKNYSRLSVVIQDGATLGNASSKWDMTYAVTIKAGGVLQSGRGVSSSIGNSHIKNTLTIGEAGAEKRAKVRFVNGLSGITHQTMSIAVLYNGKLVANNADIEVGDFGFTGASSITDCNVTAVGIIAWGKNDFYKHTVTDSTIVIKGHNVMNENTYYSTTGTLMHNLTVKSSSITVDDGVADTVAEKVTIKTLTLNDSTVTVEAGTAVDVAGAMKMDADSSLIAGALTINGGSITIDAAGFTSGFKTVIDLSGTASLEGKVTVNNLASGVNVVYGADGDVSLTDQSNDVVYVNSAWTADNADGKVFGYNAFADFKTAYDCAPATLYVVGNAEFKTGTWDKNVNVVIKDGGVLTGRFGGDPQFTAGSFTIEAGGKLEARAGGNNFYFKKAFVMSGTEDNMAVIDGYMSGTKSYGDLHTRWGGSVDVNYGDITVGLFYNNASGAKIANSKIYAGLTVYWQSITVSSSVIDIAGGKYGSYTGANFLSGTTIKDSVLNSGLNAGKSGTLTADIINGLTLENTEAHFLGSSADTITKLTVTGSSTVEFEGGATISTLTVKDNAQVDFKAASSIGAKKTVTIQGNAVVSFTTLAHEGTIKIDATSQLKADSITGAGTFVIDASKYTGGFKQVIDLDGTTSLEGKVTISNGDGVKAVYGADGDVYLTNLTNNVLYVNSDWAGKKLGDDIDGKVYGYNAFGSLAEIAGIKIADGADTTIKFENDVTEKGTLEFKYGNGDIYLTADKAVTLNTRDFVFCIGQDADNRSDIYVGENVTINIVDNNTDLAIYYGANIHINGTVTGGQNWGSLYLFNGSEHTVGSTGTVSIARVQVAFTTLSVNGDAESARTDAHIDTKYLLVEGSTFNANNAIIDAEVIHDSNNGGMRWGASEFNFNNSKLTAGSLTIQYADSVVNFTGSDAEISGAVTNAGKINIDNTAFAGDITGTGSINVYGESELSGVVAQKIVFGSAEKSVDADVDVTGWKQVDFTVQNGTVDITGQMAMAADASGLAPMLVGGFYNNNGTDIRGEAAMGSTVVNVAADALVKAHQVYIADNEAVNEHTLNVYGEVAASASIFNKAMGNLNVYGQVSANYLQAAGDVTVSGTAAKLNLAGVGGNGAVKVGTDVEGLRSQFVIADGATVDADGAFAIGYNNGSRQGDLVLSSGKLDVASLSIDAGSSLLLNAVNGVVLVGGELSGTGSITIDATDFTGSKLLVDVSSSTFTGKITLTNAAENVSIIYGADGDIVLSDVTLDTIYVNSAWADNAYGDIIEGKIFGVNAFASLESISTEASQGIRKVVYTASESGSMTLTVEGEKYTAYTIAGENSYVMAGRSKDISIAVTAGEEYTFEFTNATGDFELSSKIAGLNESEFVDIGKNPVFADTDIEVAPGTGAKSYTFTVAKDHTADFHFTIDLVQGKLAYTLTKAGADKAIVDNLTMGDFSRTIRNLADGTYTFAVDTYAGKDSLFNLNAEVSLKKNKVVKSEHISDADDTSADAASADGNKLDFASADASFQNWVGAEDLGDWVEITNFTAGANATFTLNVEEGDSRVSATIYSQVDGGRLRQVRSWSSADSASTTLALSADRYFVRINGIGSSNYTLQLA